MSSGSCADATPARSALETDGTVRYRVANLSDEDVPNLTARVVFYYPPGAEQTGIALPYVTDVTEETEFRLFRGQNDYEVVATSREFAARKEAGDAILATRLDVEQEKPIAITARDGSAAGTRVMKGRLECVAISPEDERLGMDGAPPELWLDFANVSGERVKNVQFSAVFMDTQGEAIVSQTAWAALPTLEPGDTGRVEFDLSDVGSVRHLPFLVRARVKLRIN